MDDLQDDPEELERYVERTKRRIDEATTDALREMHLRGRFDNQRPAYSINADDRSFLRATGVSPDDRAYVAAPFSAGDRRRVLGPLSFPARLVLLCDTVAALERDGRRPTAVAYRELLEESFGSSDPRLLPPGALLIVSAELDSLGEECSLVASERCAGLLGRVDPALYKVFTAGWPFADLGWC